MSESKNSKKSPPKESKTTKTKDSSSSSKTETKSTTKEAPKAKATPPKSTPIQNGKGSSPRNMGPQFLENYENIKGMSKSKKRKEGQKFVKVYK